VRTALAIFIYVYLAMLILFPTFAGKYWREKHDLFIAGWNSEANQ
jgi:hypothetical protein